MAAKKFILADGDQYSTVLYMSRAILKQRMTEHSIINYLHTVHVVPDYNIHLCQKDHHTINVFNRIRYSK
jgi:hypothetical protein